MQAFALPLERRTVGVAAMDKSGSDRPNSPFGAVHHEPAGQGRQASTPGGPEPRARAEINSPPAASSGMVASLFSLRGARQTRVRPPRQFPREEVGVVNGVPYQ